jgi:hypothetical protein
MIKSIIWALAGGTAIGWDKWFIWDKHLAGPYESPPA